MNIKKYNLYLEEDKSFKFPIQLLNADMVANFCRTSLKLDKESQEVLYLISSDTKNKITGVFELSRGTINKSLCSPMEIFKRLILNNSNNFIIVHNHLSNIEPSKEDIELYKTLKKASKLMEINFNDSLIICGNKYYSFFEDGIEYEK